MTAHHLPAGATPSYGDLTVARPHAATLFDWLDARDNKHTNSIALYDVMPKYVFHAPSIRRVSADGLYLYFPAITRAFQFEKREYTLTITPARIRDDDAKERDYYPGELEQWVEMALRRISIARQRTHFFGGHAGLKFTLSELRSELAAVAHSASFAQLRRALEIMNRCRLEIATGDGSLNFSAAILPFLGIRQRQHDGGDVTFAAFNPMITDAISRHAFRQIDYIIHASMKSHIARWLHLRLVHVFIQASIMGDPYNIAATTIIRDAGLKYARPRQAFGRIRGALAELKERGVLMGFRAEQMVGSRNAVVDEVYHLRPSPAFADEQKRANRLRAEVERKARGGGW